MSTTELQTSRLLLTALSAGDDNFIFELLTTEECKQFIGNRNIRSVTDATEYINSMLSNSNARCWVVRLKADEKAIGIVTLIKRDYLERYDISTAFLPVFTRNGYAYEAVQTILYCINDPEQHPLIFAITASDNPRSMRLLSKLGFQFNKQLVVENQTQMIYQISTDHLSVSEITNVFLGVFTNKGKNAELDVLSNICYPHTSFTNVSKANISVSDLFSFISSREVLLTGGSLQDFEERELYSETRIFTAVAFRHLEYEKSGILNGKSFRQKGKKIIQFAKEQNAWKICSILWEDEEM